MQDTVFDSNKVARSVSSRRLKEPQDVAIAVQTSECEVKETFNADETLSSSVWEPLSNLVDVLSCPDSAEPEVLHSYTRILKRIPCWFGSQFDYHSCSVCEEYASALLLYPDSMPLESRCSHCSALFFHYTMTFLPALKGVDNDVNQRQRYILPENISEKISKQVFNDDVVSNFAQIFVEGPGNQILVRTFGV